MRIPLPFGLSLIGLLALSPSGCMSNTHVIPKKDLAALSTVHPEQRGERVRVIQGLSGAESPPEAPRARGGAVVVVHAPIWVGGTPRARSRPRTSGPTRTGPGGATRTGPGGASRTGGPAPTRSRHSQTGKAHKHSAKAWLVVAGTVAAALAFTEGMRYDGWVRLHPMHPVHLYGPGGTYTWMPLAHVTPDVAAWSQKAFVRPHEGPWEELGRAPLNRKGWTYAVLLGASEIQRRGDVDPTAGFLGHIQIGNFPTREFGVLLDIGFGWADDDLDRTTFDARYAIELEYLPLSAGRLYAGGFGQVGIASRLDDSAQHDESSSLLGGGGLLQLELTTRLALMLRAGVTALHGETASELGLGLAVY